ncbi:hypothetical protein DUI87_15254 [Hirundo rustica rustica]|uniref:Uncharacterized protein n=1 Tax=Hirundo rustica rustica TaxID=333673 RepID=A0A3M0K3F0_HIRRU|nr:hypothetical protein DUI87_15254 [Hirundo rustica rustica]
MGYALVQEPFVPPQPVAVRKQEVKPDSGSQGDVSKVVPSHYAEFPSPTRQWIRFACPVSPLGSSTGLCDEALLFSVLRHPPGSSCDIKCSIGFGLKRWVELQAEERNLMD